MADGLAGVTVLPVSAVRGDNLDAVRRILVDRVSRESNAARTASAELDTITTRLRPTAAHREIVLDPAGAQSMVPAKPVFLIVCADWKSIVKVPWSIKERSMTADHDKSFVSWLCRIPEISFLPKACWMRY